VVRSQEMRLDRKDVEILSLLRADARMPLKEIASKVALSVPAVKARVKRMRELGVIKAFTAVIDPSKIAERVRVYIMCKIPVPCGLIPMVRFSPLRLVPSFLRRYGAQ
jgi:Lrp/AsnC family transcriptional regulator, leucine-responsive regulatory protein